VGSRTRRAALAASLVLLATMLPAAVAAGPQSCDDRSNNNIQKLLECVTLEGVREHQAALQEIADDNDGTRVSGTAGYDESVDYAVEILEAAGYDVTRQEFDFVRFEVLSASILQQVAPLPAADLAHIIMSYSGSGDVTAAVASPNPVTGCFAADWAGFPAGNIALIQRGGSTAQVTCTFALKALNAIAAGAVGVVIYNNAAGDLAGTLGNTFAEDVPVVGITQALGEQLRATAGLVLRIKTDVLREPATAENVLAETTGGNANNVVMAGAHLDSVSAGPGINDNGSGSGVILEVAEQMATVQTRNKVRFALWGAEEASLVGSTFYINNLSDEDHARIALI
jgi:Zn-dependent M28 family amino/carboxypeptidase